jgi:hypothetical protein
MHFTVAISGWFSHATPVIAQAWTRLSWRPPCRQASAVALPISARVRVPPDWLSVRAAPMRE